MLNSYIIEKILQAHKNELDLISKEGWKRQRPKKRR